MVLLLLCNWQIVQVAQVNTLVDKGLLIDEHANDIVECLLCVAHQLLVAVRILNDWLIYNQLKPIIGILQKVALSINDTLLVKINLVHIIYVILYISLGLGDQIFNFSETLRLLVYLSHKRH